MDFDHPKFRFVELSSQRNGERFLIDVDTLMVGDPELLHIMGDPELTVVGDINMENYQKVKVRELELPSVVVGEKKKKILPAVPSLAQLRGKNKAIVKDKEDKEEKDSKKESKTKKESRTEKESKAKKLVCEATSGMAKLRTR